MKTSIAMPVRPAKTSSLSADTRQRLIDAAATLFGERGFEHVTVREICKASNANVAAINYHFGDKAGLYGAVVNYAIQLMQETNEESQRAGHGLSPEDQLRGFVRVFVSRITGQGPRVWIHKLMAREMENPSDALDQVMAQVVKPRLEYLCGVVAAIMDLPPADPRVRRCVASLQSQMLLAAKPIPTILEKTFGPAMRDVDAAVNHIVDFSIGGMRALAAR